MVRAVGFYQDVTWTMFKHRCNSYALITEIEKKSNNKQKAIFVNLLRNEAMNIYKGFELTESSTLTDIIEKFDRDSIGLLNTTYERYVFNTYIQNECQMYSEFETALRRLKIASIVVIVSME